MRDNKKDNSLEGATEQFNTFNKNVEKDRNIIVEQNRKINQMGEKLNNIDEKMKVTQKYTSGLTSFWGFFPKLFSGSGTKIKKNKDEEIIDKESNKNSDEIIKQQTANPSPSVYDKDDEFENEIYELNKNAKNIRKEIDISLQGTDDLNSKIDKTNKKIENVKKDVTKIQRSYN